MNTYLIDYENVREDGLNGLLQLSPTDRVVIFYTAENEKISLKWFAESKAAFTAVKVAPGSQSLDKHLVSYLGYLAGQETDTSAHYIIISRDNGYKPIAEFWNSRFGVADKISVQPQIMLSSPQVKMPEPVARKAAEPQVIKAEESQPAPVEYTEADMADLAAKALRIISETGVQDGDKKRMLMSSLCDALASDPVYRAFKSRSSFKATSFFRKLSGDITISRENSNAWVAVASESQVDKPEDEKARLLAKLTEAGLSSEEADSMEAMIEKLRAEGSNVKQRVYHESLRRFQKGRGLAVYNSVKAII